MKKSEDITITKFCSKKMLDLERTKVGIPAGVNFRNGHKSIIGALNPLCLRKMKIPEIIGKMTLGTPGTLWNSQIVPKFSMRFARRGVSGTL